MIAFKIIRDLKDYNLKSFWIFSQERQSNFKSNVIFSILHFWNRVKRISMVIYITNLIFCKREYTSNANSFITPSIKLTQAFKFKCHCYLDVKKSLICFTFLFVDRTSRSSNLRSWIISLHCIVENVHITFVYLKHKDICGLSGLDVGDVQVFQCFVTIRKR